MILDQVQGAREATSLERKPTLHGGAAFDHVVNCKQNPEPASVAAKQQTAASSKTAESHDARQWRRFARRIKGNLTADLTHMNKTLLWRRMVQRMRLAQHDDVNAYVAFLQHNAAERLALRQSLCAGFTSFFRDPDTFERLQHDQARALWRLGTPLRIWVPGCSSGQESYSWAMCLLDARPQHCQQTLKIIATDIDREALRIACAGFYTETEVQGVEAAKLERYFIREAHGYRIRDAVRNVVTFRRHDMLGTGKIRHIDAISCRNLLTAMTPRAQRRITRRCAAVLCDGGFFIVGATESIRGANRWFEAVDRARHIYRRRPRTKNAGHDHQPLGSAVTHLDLAQHLDSSHIGALCAQEVACPRQACAL